MEKAIILSPEELYYMGRLMKAKYIDYAYIAAMKDIKQNYSLFKKETQASLVDMGILVEDFSGEIEIDAIAYDVFKPVFFGEVETSVDICSLGEPNKISVNKFHFNDCNATMVTNADGKLVIKSVDQIAIRDFVSNLISEQYDCSCCVVDKIEQDAIARVLSVKSAVVGGLSVVKLYIESDGAIYRENGERIESMTREMFIEDVYETVKGV